MRQDQERDVRQHLPEPVRRYLKGESFVAAAEAFTQSRAHGTVQAVRTAASWPRVAGSSGPRARPRTRLRPRHCPSAGDHPVVATLADKFGVADADENELYAAWLLARPQEAVGSPLLRGMDRSPQLKLWSALSPGPSRPQRKRTSGQLLCNGCPVAVHEGNTSDPATGEVRRIREDFGLSRPVLVGDRGMQTKIRELRKREGRRSQERRHPLTSRCNWTCSTSATCSRTIRGSVWSLVATPTSPRSHPQTERTAGGDGEEAGADPQQQGRTQGPRPVSASARTRVAKHFKLDG